jgi:hypothetical protein
MPTPFETDRGEVSAIVKAKNCKDAAFVDATTTYAELAALMFAFTEIFSCLPSYLEDLLTVIPDAELLTENIYFNKTLPGPITNPIFIVKSTLTNVEIQGNGDVEALHIHHGSVIDTLTIKSGTDLQYLLVAGGSVINNLVIEDGATIDYIGVKTCNGKYASSVPQGCDFSKINAFYFEEVGELGIEGNDNPYTYTAIGPNSITIPKTAKEFLIVNLGNGLNVYADITVTGITGTGVIPKDIAQYKVKEDSKDLITNDIVVTPATGHQVFVSYTV